MVKKIIDGRQANELMDELMMNGRFTDDDDASLGYSHYSSTESGIMVIIDR